MHLDARLGERERDAPGADAELEHRAATGQEAQERLHGGLRIELPVDLVVA